MTKEETLSFIEEREEIGDKWTEEEVQKVYGDFSLSEALNDRKRNLYMYFENIGKILNMDKKFER